MTPVERLFARLRAQSVELPDSAQFHRTYAGRVQRAQGAWSWFVLDAEGRDLRLGSQWAVGVLLRATRLIVSDPHAELDRHVDPEPLPSPGGRTR